jgi:hypothetical protein
MMAEEEAEAPARSAAATEPEEDAEPAVSRHALLPVLLLLPRFSLGAREGRSFLAASWFGIILVHGCDLDDWRRILLVGTTRRGRSSLPVTPPPSRGPLRRLLFGGGGRV